MTKFTKQEVINILGLQNEIQLEALKNDRQKVKSLYRLLAKKYHPDRKGGSHELFLQFQTAFEAFENDDYLDSFNDYEWNCSQYNETDSYTPYTRTNYSTTTAGEYATKATSKDYIWFLLWPLQGLVYGITFILLNLIYAVYLLAGLAAFVAGIFCIYKAYTIVFCDAGTITEALKYVGILVLCWLAITPAEWMSEKKDDLLVKVWVWWRM